MTSNLQGDTAQSADQSSKEGGMLASVTDKLSSAVGEGQGSRGEQSYLSQGRSPKPVSHTHNKR